MKTLRAKIFLFISLLILLPSLPLSYFVLQLLDKSYRIGVNESVESALEGALEISADLYQMHKSSLKSLLDDLQRSKTLSNTQIAAGIENALETADYKIIKRTELDYHEPIIPIQAIKRFLNEKKVNIIWPNPEHKTLFALALVNEDQILEIVYPLPKSFRNSATQIQEVNHIYKTLGFARSEIRQSFLYTFLAIYSIGVVITLLVLYEISKKITRPIEQLTAATREIGKGNLNYRINLRGRDEFGLLAASFDRMVEELSGNQRQIIELEKRAAWQQLARKLAHEIKNPLTPIQLMAQQMRDTFAGNDPAIKKTLDECYEIIDEEVESLKKLVREFSDFARLPEFQIENQDIIPLIKILEKLYHQNNLKIELPEHEINLEFDSEYMKRALINIIDNAIAASVPEKPILLKIKAEKDTIKMTITDQGIGINPENLTKIFEPYYSSKRSGVGLGLPIVKKIIEEHRGKIQVDSIPGSGTSVTIILPKPSAASCNGINLQRTRNRNEKTY